jgi:hypothetical protein
VCHTFNDLVACAEGGSYVADSFVEDGGALWRPYRSSALWRVAAQRLDRTVARPKATAVAPEWSAAYARNLRRMVLRGRERGAAVVLVTEPHCLRPTLAASVGESVPGLGPWYRDYSTLEYAALLAGVKKFHEESRAVATELSAPFVDLEPVMPDHLALWRSPIHHSEAGEAVVADHLARELEELGLVPARPER